MISEESKSKPVLYGLVLAGGKSVRMGHDKSVMQWHGKEQRYYMADLLKEVCSEVFISCRELQQKGIDKNYQTLVDSVYGAGPLVGILSALKAHAGVAWLVVACDLPLLDLSTLQFLIQNRDTDAIATTFKSPHDGLPEPLITIWEPASLEKLQVHIADGFTCPRKALIRNEALIKILIAPNPDALINANTPQDAEKVTGMLRSEVRNEGKSL